jgi:hypothetical protein
VRTTTPKLPYNAPHGFTAHAAHWLLKDRNIILKGADATTARGFTQVPNFLLKSDKWSAGDKLAFAMLLSYAWQRSAAKKRPKRSASRPSSGWLQIHSPTESGFWLRESVAAAKRGHSTPVKCAVLALRSRCPHATNPATGFDQV